MPTECSATLFEFAPVEGRHVVAAFDGGSMTSDAGALLLGETDRVIQLTARFAACFTDARLRNWWSTKSARWCCNGLSVSHWATRT